MILDINEFFCVSVAGLLKPSQIIMSDPLIKEATKLKVKYSFMIFFFGFLCYRGLCGSKIAFTCNSNCYTAVVTNMMPRSNDIKTISHKTIRP